MNSSILKIPIKRVAISNFGFLSRSFWIAAPVSNAGTSSRNTKSNINAQGDTKSHIDALILNHSLLSTHHRAHNQDNLMRCTVLDTHGTVEVVSGEFRRSELLSRHDLLPRDLRKLDVGVTSIVPSILVRKNSILVNLLHIRALIQADLVLIFSAYGSTDSQTQSVFINDLSHKLRGNDDLNSPGSTNTNLPYELRALESIFVSVVSALEAEMQVLLTVVNGILNDLEINIDRNKLRHLLVQSKKLTAFLQKATLIRDAIEELLEHDENLEGLYLTAKKTRDQSFSNSSEAEMLLESYYIHCDEIVQTIDNLVSNIRSTEEIINIILDSNRNSLMLLSLKFQIGTLGLGAGAFASGFYGMNLENFIEETNWGFALITGIASVVAITTIMWSLSGLRKVQRMAMMSKQHKVKIHTFANSPMRSLEYKKKQV